MQVLKEDKLKCLLLFSLLVPPAVVVINCRRNALTKDEPKVFEAAIEELL